MVFIKNHAPISLILLGSLKKTEHMFFLYHLATQKLLIPNTNHPNGGVRGGTIRLLPVDSKAEAKRSRLLSS